MLELDTDELRQLDSSWQPETLSQLQALKRRVGSAGEPATKELQCDADAANVSAERTRIADCLHKMDPDSIIEILHRELSSDQGVQRLALIFAPEVMTNKQAAAYDTVHKKAKLGENSNTG